MVTMCQRTAVWKAALWGAVAGRLPDRDVLIDHGDPIRHFFVNTDSKLALPHFM